VASLIGVIVSHMLDLFDFIEEMHEKGEPFEQALRDAGIGGLAMNTFITLLLVPVFYSMRCST
jgi:multidrug efflux pump subunit AcrB